MSKHAKTLFIFAILGTALAGIVLWRSKTTQSFNSKSPNLSETTIEDSDTAFVSFIESLRKRDYKPSEITIEGTLSNNGSYTGYQISYLSDGLKIYGRMNVPVDNGPFPVIILNHGYFNTSSFTSGDGTQTMSDILARNGYITLASNYRGFGKSENDGQGSRGHRPEYAIDVLNLIASVNTLDKADSGKIGMWGHSMGGEVALRSVEATDEIKALVLWAPTSARVSDNAGFYGGRRNQPQTNPYSDGTSPADYLHYISSPISLHQGLSDTEVNPEWSKELNEPLNEEGKTVDYFEYPGQDHNFRNLGWDVISKRTIEFFDRYLKI